MAFAGLATEVLPRTPFEQGANLRRRLREVVEEQHGLWIMGGALAATMAVTALILTVLSLATPVHPRSLAGILHTSGSLGSNANPIWFAGGASLPRVSADARAAAMLIQPLPPLLIDNLALAAVVTREGLLASVEILREGAPDADLARAVSELASGMRFLPARAARRSGAGSAGGAPAGGTPVAANFVWLLERTTVRGKT